MLCKIVFHTLLTYIGYIIFVLIFVSTTTQSVKCAFYKVGFNKWVIHMLYFNTTITIFFFNFISSIK